MGIPGRVGSPEVPGVELIILRKAIIMKTKFLLTQA
jgi:hypothetical protein